MSGASFFGPFLRILRRDRFLLGCALFLFLVVIAAYGGAWFTGYDPQRISPASLQQPSRAHWCGTDLNGRDLFTRILFGAQISLAIAAFGTLVSLLIGVAYGMLSGYAGGRIDNLMMRFVEILYSLPQLVLVIVLVATLEGGMATWLQARDWRWINPRVFLLIFFLGLTQWLAMARIVRGQVLVLKEQAYVQAALALGQSHGRILFHHLLPNLSGIIVVYLTLTIPSVMLDESFLSFLGLGVQQPIASWGTLVSEGAGLINPLQSFWWTLFFPGGLITLTLLAFNFLGDGLRDAFDPRLRRS